MNWWKIQILLRKLSRTATKPQNLCKFLPEKFPSTFTDYLSMYIPSFILRHNPAFCSRGEEPGNKDALVEGLGMRPTNHMGLGMRSTNHWSGNETN